MRLARLWLLIVVLALLGAMAAKNLLITVPPLRVVNGPGEFDANRAVGRLAQILGDQQPHPTDSTASDAVRDRLVAQLRDLGLQPIVRDQIACNELYKSRGVSCARVRNVIAIAGPIRGKAILLNAHYDSSPVGPGAGDDGIGVATLLEVAEALKSDRLRRPVIFLFNEGEELGLIGARAFLADPLSRSVDSLVNLEARGVRGPVNMFETSRPNAAAIALFGKSAEHPVANSLSTDVYRLMPNYTDVNTLSERGWLTLNLAPIGNETRYHSAGDDLASLDRGTLQHMGDQTLALARKLGAGTPSAAGDRIFMDVVGRVLVSLPLAAGVALFLALLMVLGLRVARGGGSQLRAAAVIVGAVVLSGALCWALLGAIGAARGGAFWRAYPIWTHLTVYAAVVVSAAGLIATAGRPVPTPQLRAMFWFLFLVFGGAIGLFAPGGIIFFLFPPLAVALGATGRRWWTEAERAGSYVAIALLFVTWGAMLGLLEELLNAGPLWVFAPLSALLIVPVLIELRQLIDRAGTRAALTAAGVPALACAAAACLAPTASADRQQRFTIEHVTDAAKGRAYWSILNGADPLPEAYRATGTWRRGKLPYADQLRWLADGAPIMSVRAPEVTILSTVRNGRERTVTMRLSARGAERVALIAPDDAQIRAAGVGGFVRPISAEATEGRYLLSCTGRACEGIDLTIVTARSRPIEMLLVGSRSGLPSSAKKLTDARPRYARPQYTPDQTVAFSRTRI